MAIWKEPVAPPRPATGAPQDIGRKDGDTTAGAATSTYDFPRRGSARGEAKESVIAADLTIEGKIEGAGHIRLAGNFKGDVNVDGNLTIEEGAKVTGGVRAKTIIIAGELEGNIDAASRVELLETGVMNGDVKAGTLTVAAGSRMRGHAVFGWDERAAGGDGGSSTAS